MMRQLTRILLLAGCWLGLALPGALNDANAQRAFQRAAGTFQNEYAQGVAATEDGGYAVLGRSTIGDEEAPRLVVSRYDAQDAEVWLRYVELSGAATFGYDIKQTPDGGFAVVGAVRSQIGFTNAAVVKLNADGSVAWSYGYGQQEANEELYGVALAPNGDFVCAGYLWPDEGPARALYLRVNGETGDLVWSHIGNAFDLEQATGIAAASDGTFYVSGGSFTDESAGSGWIAHLDGDGNIVWKNVYDLGAPGGFVDVGLDAAGDIYVIGEFETSPDQSSIAAMRVDPAGEPVWARIFPTADEIYSMALTVTDAGTLILNSEVYTEETGTDLLGLHVTADGDLAWSRAYGTEAEEWNDFRGDAAALNDGTILYVGATEATLCGGAPESNSDYHFVAYGLDGVTGCEGLERDYTVQTLEVEEIPFDSFEGQTAVQFEREFRNVVRRDFSRNVPFTYANVCEEDVCDFFTFTAKTQRVSCEGAENGRILVSTGCADFEAQYALNDVLNVVPGEDFENLPSGEHTVFAIYNDAQCVQELTFDLSQPNALTCGATALQQPDEGESNGIIVITASGGAQGADPVEYEFSIDGGETWQGGNNFVNLPEGTYMPMARIGTATDCVSECGEIELSSETGDCDLEFSLLLPDIVLCAGSTDGFVFVESVTGGVAPYQYSLDNMAFQEDGAFTGIGPGQYTMYAIDAEGCLDSTEFVIEGLPEIRLDEDNLNFDAGVCGANEGFIDAPAAGGDGSYSYSLNGGDFQPSSLFENLPNGPYTLLIQDGNNCQATFQFELLTPDVTVELDVRQPDCENPGGRIEATADGGAESYTYSFDGFEYQDESVFDDVPCGQNYAVYARTDAGCVGKSASVFLACAIGVEFEVETTAPTCFNSDDGAISINVIANGESATFSLDGTNFTTSTEFENLAPGAYTVYARSQTGCLDSADVVIDIPNPIVLNDVQTNPSDCQDPTGQIIAFAEGGTGQLEYALDDPEGDFQTNGIFENLAAGEYTVYVRDENGCQLERSVTVGAEADFDFTLEVSAPICFGGTDGSIIISNVEGVGDEPWEYSIDGGVNWSSSNRFEGLQAGTYDVWARDESGCSDDTTLTLTSVDQIITSINVVENPGCTEATGVIDVLVTDGGVAPFEYRVNDDDYQTENRFSDLPAGVHTAFVRDANLCEVSQEFTLTAEVDFQVAAPNVTNESCFGAADGGIAVVANGGSGDFSYALNSDEEDAFGDNNIFEGLAPGQYLVYVRDNESGCVDFRQANVQAATEIVLNVQSEDPGCGNGGVGTIDVSAVGGRAPYEYALNDGDLQSDGSFEDLEAGSYTVRVVDANGCESTATVSLEETNILAFDDIEVNMPMCGMDNGSIRILVSGGSGNFEYSIDGGANWQANNVFANISAQSYQVVARDVNQVDCITESRTVVLFGQDDIDFEAEVTQQPSCADLADGQVTVTVGPEIESPEFSSNGVSYQQGNTLTGLGAGLQIIYVRDGATDCVDTAQVFIEAPDEIEIDVAITPPSCVTSTNGSITITATNGAAPYRYSLNNINFRDSNRFINLPVGDTTVTVRDANGCTARETISIVSDRFISVDTVITQTASCGAADGSALISASGTDPDNFEYSLNGGSYQVEPLFEGLAGGEYRVSVRDADGCIVSGNFALENNNDLGLSFELTQPNCANPCSGVITFNIAGGVAPFTVLVNGSQVNTGGTNSLRNLCAGDYEIEILDESGCRDAQTVTINPFEGVTFEVEVAQAPGCAGPDSGIIEIVADGGSGEYEYSIGGAGFQDDARFENLTVGSYRFDVRDSDGCLATPQVFELTEGESISIDNVILNTPACGQADGSIEIEASSELQDDELTYRLNNGEFQDENIFENLPGGNYAITIRSISGCQLTDSVQLPNDADFDLAFDVTPTSCGASDDGVLEINSVTGGVPPYMFSLDGDEYQSDSTFDGLFGGEYQLFVEDATGCLYVEVVQIASPDEIMATINQVRPTCTATTDGELTINANGGAGGFEYALNSSDEEDYQTSNVFEDLSEGVYDVFIRDAVGCVIVVRDTLNAIGTSDEDFRIGEVLRTRPTCEGLDNGKIRVSAEGGQRPYEYSLDGVNYQVNPNFFDLAAGEYQLWARDAGDCNEVGPVDFELPARLSENYVSNVNVEFENCADGGLATLEIETVNYPGVFTYSLDGENFVEENVFEGLPAGDYTVFVRASNRCESSQEITINPPSGVDVESVRATAPICRGAMNGFIQVRATSQDLPLEYALNDGDFGESPRFENLAPGDYEIYIRNASGCVRRETATVPESPNALEIAEINATEPGCFNGNDGSLEIVVEGGEDVEYAVTGRSFQASGVFADLPAGDYRIRVRDARGCAVEAEVEIGAPIAIALTVNRTNPSAQGANDGTIEAAAFDGAAPYEFSLGPNNYQGSNSFAGLNEGIYVVFVRDANGCEARRTVQLRAEARFACERPANLSVGEVSGGEADLTWSSAQGATRYLLRYRPVAGGEWINRFANLNAFTLRGLEPQTEYEAQVRTECGNGDDSPWSQTLRFGTDSQCEAPQIFSVEPGEASITIRWNAVVNAQSYQATFRALGSGGPWRATTIMAPMSELELEDLEEGEDYVVRVRANCGERFSAWSAPARATTLSGRAGLANDDFASPLSVYPNPNNGRFQVSLTTEAAGAAALELFDLSGKLVALREAELVSGENVIDFGADELAAGVYVLRFGVDGDSRQIRVIVQ